MSTKTLAVLGASLFFAACTNPFMTNDAQMAPSSSSASSVSASSVSTSSAMLDVSADAAVSAGMKK